jgi:hypothetical protein
MASSSNRSARANLIFDCSRVVTYSKIGYSSAVNPQSKIGHGLGRFKSPPAHEHPQPAKQPLLVGAQQVVAPVDRAADGLLAGRVIARAAGQQRRWVRQVGEQRLGCEQLDARGCQLDRQRQPIQPAADLRHRRRVRVRQREIRFRRLRAR